MNFDLNAKSSPQHRRPARRPARQKSAQQPPTASVPISVYRELSAELQATQTLLDSLHGQNQNLRKQNLHLQEEVDGLVQAAQKRQSIGGRQNPSYSGHHPSASDALSVQTEADPNLANSNLAPGPVGQGDRPPQLRRGLSNFPQSSPSIMPPCVSEPPRPQEMPIMPAQGAASLNVMPMEASAQPQHQSQPQAETERQVVQRAGTSPLPPGLRQNAVETLNKIFTGREQPLPRSVLDEESAEEIHTGWLVLIVLLIVVTAFGTGFMIVRPFLSTNR